MSIVLSMVAVAVVIGIIVSMAMEIAKVDEKDTLDKTVAERAAKLTAVLSQLDELDRKAGN
jgi:cell division protein FtsL